MNKISFISILLSLTLLSVPCFGEEYHKAVEGSENVKPKIYPKKSRVELNAPDLGIIMNQSYIDTFLIHGGLNYYNSEEWGFGAEFVYAINQNKPERACIETFYNDPEQTVGPECGSQGDPEADLAAGKRGNPNYGPAYVPIREINYVFMGNVVWTPVYGKQLIFLSSTSYFDMFITMGGGFASSTFYPKQQVLKNGKTSRGTAEKNEKTGAHEVPTNIGAASSEDYAYGEDGRPDPQQETNPLINIGLGQRYHFLDRFSVKIELRNWTLIGTSSGFENYFALWGGLGFRF